MSKIRIFLFVTLVVFINFPRELMAEEKAAPQEKPAAEAPAAASPAANPVASAAATAGPTPAAAAPEAAKKNEEREPAMAAKPIALNSEGLKELEQRERTIDEREKELAERERAVQMQEKILQNKLKRIEEVSQKMASKLDKFKEESESKVVKLVAMLETMKPDAAAAYIENVDPYLAVEVLARINVGKAAKIWNKMDKKISARLSELYTGFRSRMDKEEAAPAPTQGSPKPASVPPQGKS